MTATAAVAGGLRRPWQDLPPWLSWCVAFACLLGFVSLNVHLWTRSCVVTSAAGGFTCTASLWQALSAVVDGTPPFVGLAVAGILLARRLGRWSALLPVAAYAFLPWLVDHHEWLAQPVGVRPIDAQGRALIVMVQLLLLALPGVVLGRQRSHERVAVPGALALTTTLAACIGVLYLDAATSLEPRSWWSATAVMLPVFTLGASASGRGKPAWISAVAATTAITVEPLLPWLRGESPAIDVHPLLVGFVVLVIAGSWRSLSVVLSSSREKPRLVLILVNGLNAADALATAVGLRGGIVAEANPVVRVVGLPAKVIVVAIASWLIFRSRPKALIWPAAILSLVCLWHLQGLLTS